MLGMKIFLNLTERGVASTSIYVSNQQIKPSISEINTLVKYRLYFLYRDNRMEYNNLLSKKTEQGQQHLPALKCLKLIREQTKPNIMNLQTVFSFFQEA